MTKLAIIILVRNNPNQVVKLHETMTKWADVETDFYVVECGTKKDNLSGIHSFYADWPFAIENGLRYPRGINFALEHIHLNGKLKEYDAIMFLNSDVVVPHKAFLSVLLRILDKNPKLGIISPSSAAWGETLLLGKNNLRCFWHIHNNALMFRREALLDLLNFAEPNHMGFLFDGHNFHGFCCELEVISKAYLNGWAAAITSEVFIERDSEYLFDFTVPGNIKKQQLPVLKAVEEGRNWMKQKYGFNSHWDFLWYAKSAHDTFFKYNHELEGLRVDHDNY